MKNSPLGATALLLALASAAPGYAQQKTVTIGAYGGSFEQTMRKEIIPAFEAKHGVKVEYVAGNSTDTLRSCRPSGATSRSTQSSSMTGRPTKRWPSASAPFSRPQTSTRTSMRS